MNPNSFKCPECGSTEPSVFMLVETDFSEDDAWSGVLQRCKCARCNFTIPAHLAERWHDISYDQAVQEWRQTYRSSAPRHPAN